MAEANAKRIDRRCLLVTLVAACLYAFVGVVIMAIRPPHSISMIMITGLLMMLAGKPLMQWAIRDA